MGIKLVKVERGNARELNISEMKEDRSQLKKSHTGDISAYNDIRNL